MTSSAADVPIQISDIVYPVHVLGPGRRVGIWMQGCSIGCRGCMATHTWAASAGITTTVADVLKSVSGHSTNGLDGITISGGEPSEQPEALRALLVGLQAMPHAAERDILVYTGRSGTWVSGEGSRLFIGADAVMAEPFDVARMGSSPLRGSENQDLITLTPLGELRFAQKALPPRRQIQLYRLEDQLVLIGIPGPEDLEHVRGMARDQGLKMKALRWTV